MFDDKNLGSRMLSNPGAIQREALLELEQRHGGEITIADPNNGFVFLMEMASSIVAQYTKSTEAQFDGLYPKRAITADQLYKHMSDQDYVHIMSKPAQTSMVLILDRDYLIENARVYNEDYKKVVIPATTKFSIGGRKYGIYYPIEIRINVRTSTFLVTYDTTSKNPLHTLTTNMLETQQYPRNGINFLAIKIPVYQFDRTVYTEAVQPEQGFNRDYGYNSRFYTARVFTNRSGKWVELDYTFSDDVYDRSRATAKVRVASDTGRVQVSIPQIYFTKGLIGNTVRTEIYVTEGELDVPITLEESQAVTVDFDLRVPEASPFSSVLSNLSTIVIYPAENRITGGSNGISLDDLRERVIYGALYKTLPISPLDLQKYVSDQGFTLTKHLDNVTNRIYYANRKMTGGQNTTIPVTIANIELRSSRIQDVPSILTFSDNITTILPTTLYRYLDTNQICVPLTTDELVCLSSLTKEQIADELNTYPYTRMPFHIVTYTNGKYPVTKTFNLNTPEVQSIQFISENVQAPQQMVVTTAQVLHRGNGTGGFAIQMGVTKTTDLSALPESDIAVLLFIRDRAGRRVYIRATKIGSQEAYDIYEAQIESAYRITSDRHITTTMQIDEETTVSSDIPLDATFDVRLLVRKSSIDPVASDLSLTAGIPDDFVPFVGLVKQEMHIVFGEDMSDAIFNPTDVIWEEEQYVKWPETVYHTYDNDIYETDANGVLQYVIVDGEVVLNKLHSKGDVVLDSEGNAVVKHAAGDYKRDEFNRPIPLGQRDMLYFVQSMMFDARLYASESRADINYLKTVSSEIVRYVKTVSAMRSNLIEQTKLYYRPVRTIGTATFGLGNGNTARFNLGLGFNVKYYVPRSVMADTALLSVIETTTKTVIESHMGKSVISMTEIATDLKAALRDSIVSIDVLGINGSPALQTLIVTEPDTAPMVALKLGVNTDGTLSLNKDIAVTFAADA